MAKNMVLPKIGVNMTEVVVTKWLVKPGDKVAEGDVLLEAETDKAIQEIPSTQTGIVAELLFEEGEIVQCNEALIVFVEENEEYNKPVKATAVQTSSSPSADASESAKQPAPNVKPQPEFAAQTVMRSAGPKVRISPLARKIATQHGIDVNMLSPAEQGCRIVKADVLRYLEVASETEKSPAIGQGAIMQSVPMSPLRKTIASRLSESNLEKPCAALTTTADAAGILALRETYKRRDIKLSIDAILAKIAGHTLASHRNINSILVENTIQILRDINVGVAVDTPRGLVVPVLRNADATSLSELNKQLYEMASLAKESLLTASDMSGGTFTITNLGAFGVEQFTPIINPPECCILAVGSIKGEFVPDENDQPVLKKRFQLTLVFDHRIVDGAPAARFLRDFKEYLENPALMIYSGNVS